MRKSDKAAKGEGKLHRQWENAAGERNNDGAVEELQG
jgi:hypothetical protein